MKRRTTRPTATKAGSPTPSRRSSFAAPKHRMVKPGGSAVSQQRLEDKTVEWVDGIPVIRLPEVPRDYSEARNPLNVYLQSAAEVPLLTVDEENALAARIKKGDPVAREHMIRANLRLVVKIARDYDGLGLPLLDLINEGNMGLMKAVERFDPAKGGKLSTYGAWWIKQSIKRALANQSKTIRLPVHLVDKITRMKRVALQLKELLGREATDEELADELQVPVRKVRLWQRASMKTASLDQPLGDEDSSRLGEVVPDENTLSPAQKLEQDTSHDMVRGFLKHLDQRELTILRERFGLDGGPQKTLDEIGRRFGVTRERIRQLQNLALAKLRRHIENFEAVRQPGTELPMAALLGSAA